MRLFLAITFPPQIKKQLAEYAQLLTVGARRAKNTREENFHLTLDFLGEALSVPAACAAIEATECAPFKLYSGQPGKFSRGSADILWLGLKESPELMRLYASLGQALAVQGFSPEPRPFKPHITLAREVRGLPSDFAPPPRFIVAVSSLTLMESTRVNGLLTYVPLYERCLT